MERIRNRINYYYETRNLARTVELRGKVIKGKQFVDNRYSFRGSIACYKGNSLLHSKKSGKP